MNNGYKVVLFICIILTILSILHDLNKQTFIQNTISNQVINEQSNDQYVVVHLQAKSGDTILSLIEEVNREYISELNIDEMIADFHTLNPDVHSLQLQLGKWYKIPKYIKKG